MKGEKCQDSEVFDAALLAELKDALKDTETLQAAIDKARRKIEVPKTPGNTSLSVLDNTKIATTQAWTDELISSPYDFSRGPGGELFNGWLSRACQVALSEYRVYHSCTFSLVQSSGCGKSRLVREAARTNPLLYICCADTKRKCVPPPLNTHLRSLLFPEDAPFDAGRLLRQWLSAAIAFLRRRQEEGSPLSMDEWFTLQATAPASLARDIETSAASTIDLEALCVEYFKCWTDESLVSTAVPLTFVFDEAAGLFHSGSENFRLLRKELQVLNSSSTRTYQRTGDRLRICFLFLDTNSRVSNFSHSAHVDESLRGKRDVQVDLYAPFWLTCNPVGTTPLPSTISLTECTNPRALTRFGRPLWQSALKLDPEGIIDYAHDKLFGGATGPIAEVDLSRIALATLMMTCGLSFAPTRQIAELLVARTMVFLEMVEMDRETLWLRSISEPILALGASTHLRKYTGDVFKKVRNALDNGLRAPGDVGEIAARALIVLARATALPNEAPLKWASPLPVRLLLKNILPECLQSVEVLNHSMLNRLAAFSHFVAATTAVDNSVLYSALVRNAAVQAKDNQPAYDMCVPLGPADPNEILDCCNVGGLYIQVKNKKPPARIIAHVDEQFLGTSRPGELFVRSSRFCGELNGTNLEHRHLLESFNVLKNLQMFVEENNRRYCPLVVLSLQLEKDTGWVGILEGKKSGTSYIGIICNPCGATFLSDDARVAIEQFIKPLDNLGSTRLFDDLCAKHHSKGHQKLRP